MKFNDVPDFAEAAFPLKTLNRVQNQMWGRAG